MRRSATAVPRPAVHRVAYCLAVRRYAARPPAVEECAYAPTRPAGCPGGRQPGGATRGAGERSLSRLTDAKKSLFAPGARWLVSTDLALLLGAANVASLKPGSWRSYASSRHVIHELTPTITIMAGTCCLCVAELLRVAVVLAASLREAVKGQRL